MPYYNTYQTTPAAQKSLMEVDFTPIFLALLPLFLTMGAILGLQLEGRSFDSTSATGTNVTINLNTTSSDSSSSSDSGTDKLILRQKTSKFPKFFKNLQYFCFWKIVVNIVISELRPVSIFHGGIHEFFKFLIFF